MKRILALLLACALCVSSTGCSLIQGHKANRSDKTEENADLQKAQQQTDEREAALLGTWVSEFYGDQVLQLSKDNTMLYYGNGGIWGLSADGTELTIQTDSRKQKITVFEEDGIVKLSDDGTTLVLEEQYPECFDRKFVVVTLTPENVRDYLSEPVNIGCVTDEEGYTWVGHMITSKAYDNGLVYLACSEDTQIEIVYHLPSDGLELPGIVGMPFQVIGYGFPPGIAYDEGYTVTLGEQITGTLYYVRREYVASSTVQEGNVNTICLTDGTWLLDNGTFCWPRTIFGHDPKYDISHFNFADYPR